MNDTIEAMFSMTPPPWPHHRGNRGLATQKHALDVDAVKPVELGFGRPLDVPDVRHAGVVHENVQPPCPVESGGKCCLYARRVGDIALLDVGAASGRNDERRRFPRRILIQVQNEDQRALASEHKRDSPSDAGTATRDRRHFPTEVEQCAGVKYYTLQV